LLLFANGTFSHHAIGHFSIRHECPLSVTVFVGSRRKDRERVEASNPSSLFVVQCKPRYVGTIFPHSLPLLPFPFPRPFFPPISFSVYTSLAAKVTPRASSAGYYNDPRLRVIERELIEGEPRATMRGA